MASTEPAGETQHSGPAGADGAEPAGGQRWFLPLLLPSLAGAASLAASWQHWINPLVDSGRELIVPWRLAQGEHLYRDVTYYYGPLGPWVDALVIKLFGRQFLALEVVCAALSVAIFALLYRLTARAGGRASALAATSLAAAICMGAPRGGAFVFPYSSSCLFGLLGGLLALTAWLGEVPLSWRRRALVILGLTLALTSRLELGAAAVAALLPAAAWSRERRRALGEALWTTGGSLLISGAVYVVAIVGVSPIILLTDGPLKHMLAMPKEWQHLYLTVAGLANPAKAAGSLALALALDGALVAACALFALPRADGRGAGRGMRSLLFPLLLLALLAAACAGQSPSEHNLPALLLPLPLLVGGCAVLLLRRPLEEETTARFLLFAWSAAVAARVVLGLSVGPRMGPYCAVPVPGLLASAAVLGFDLLPASLPRPHIFRRRFAALLVLFGGLFLFRLERTNSGPRLVDLETPAGGLRLPAAQAGAYIEALEFLFRHAARDATLAVFPEGGFFNFVTGLPSPLREDQFFPGVLDAHLEADVAQRIEAGGPHFILLCNRTTSEYGPVAFGRDYDTRLWQEIEDHYALVASFGRARPMAPIGAHRFFIRVYERRAERSASSPFRWPVRREVAQAATAGRPWSGERGER